MSYNPNPDWGVVAIDSSKICCDVCKQPFCLYGDDVIYNSSYYEPRHIPEKLEAECVNEECSEFGKMLEFKLKTIVYLELVKNEVQTITR